MEAYGHGLSINRTPNRRTCSIRDWGGQRLSSCVGPQLNDISAREDYVEDQELDAAIRKTGNDIKDVRAVIISHLHLDHAGGLEYFRSTDVTIYTHELELKNAFYSVATKPDIGECIPVLLRFCTDQISRCLYANLLPI